MWQRWLGFVGKSSGPDRYLLLGVFGAPAYVLGGEVVGTGILLVLIAGLLISVRLAHTGGLDRYEVGTGSEVCFACRGTFAIAATRKLARYVALLGPSTWEARQHRFCQRCARRQETMVVALMLLILGVGSVVLVEALQGS